MLIICSEPQEMSLLPGMSSFLHLNIPPWHPGKHRNLPSLLPFPQGTVFPGEKVTDKPLPVVNLTDTDTRQAPLGGSGVTAELCSLWLLMAPPQPGFPHSSHIKLAKNCGKESAESIQAAAPSTKTLTAVKEAYSSLFDRYKSVTNQT